MVFSVIVMRPDELSCTPSLCHVNEGIGLPEAEQSTVIELPKLSDNSLGMDLVKDTGSI